MKSGTSIAGWLAATLMLFVATTVMAQDTENEAGAAQGNAAQDNGAQAATEQGDNESSDAEAGGDDEAEATAQASGYADLKARWSELTAQAAAKRAEFLNAEEVDKEPLRSAYNDLITQMTALLPELTQAAMDEYKASEEPGDELTKTLLGMLINDAVFSRDREALEIAQLLIDKGCPRELFEKARGAPRLGPFSKEVIDEAIRRYDEAVADDLPRVKMVTSKGDIEIELFENEAPNTVANFISLIDKGYYNGLTFHRVLEDFVAQGGDPEGTGLGGPGYYIACECYTPDHRRHFPGMLSMAHAGKDSGGSQFFLTLNTYNRLEHANLDGKHTVFGRVISGFDVLNTLQRRNPKLEDQPEPDKMVEVTVTRRRDHDYVPDVINKEEPSEPGNTGEGSSEDGGSEDGGTADGGSEGSGDSTTEEGGAGDGEETTGDGN